MKYYEELRFADEYMFCRVMEKYPDICKDVLEVILEVKIKKVVCAGKRAPVELTSDGCGIRADVCIDDGKDTICHAAVRITTSDYIGIKTSIYENMIRKEIEERASMDRAEHSFVICVCPDDPLDCNARRYTVEYVANEDLELVLNDGVTTILLNRQGKGGKVSKELEVLLKYLNGEEGMSPLIERIEAALQEAYRNNEWQMDYLSQVMRDIDRRTDGRNEAMAEIEQRKEYEQKLGINEKEGRTAMTLVQKIEEEVQVMHKRQDLKMEYYITHVLSEEERKDARRNLVFSETMRVEEDPPETNANRPEADKNKETSL